MNEDDRSKNAGTSPAEDDELMKEITAPPEYPPATRKQVEATWQAIVREVEATAETGARETSVAAAEDQRSRPVWLGWLLPTAPAWSLQLVKVAALLVVGFAAAWYAAGRGWLPGSRRQVAAIPETPDARAVDRDATSRSWLAMNGYGERLEVLLLGLTRGQTGGAGVSPTVREVSRELLTDSRLYRRVAERLGDPALSELLSRVETILLALATVPEGQEEQLVKDLRGFIDESGLLSDIRDVRSAVPTMPRVRPETVES